VLFLSDCVRFSGSILRQFIGTAFAILFSDIKKRRTNKPKNKGDFMNLKKTIVIALALSAQISHAASTQECMGAVAAFLGQNLGTSIDQKYITGDETQNENCDFSVDMGYYQSGITGNMVNEMRFSVIKRQNGETVDSDRMDIVDANTLDKYTVKACNVGPNYIEMKWKKSQKSGWKKTYNRTLVITKDNNGQINRASLSESEGALFQKNHKNIYCGK
jgi:hypothetical protein